MSEIAIVSSRPARLLQMADAGGSGARHALTLASEPTWHLFERRAEAIRDGRFANGAIQDADAGDAHLQAGQKPE